MIDVDKINLTVDSVSFWGENSLSKGGMRVFWSSTIGIGTLDIIKRSGNDLDNPDETYQEMVLIADTETMDSNEDKLFTNKIMSLLVEKITIV